jgi:hypothetical protein
MLLKSFHTLETFDKYTRDNVYDVLVLRYLKDFEMDVLELACECKCENFVSNIIVQNILDNIWSHKNQNDSSIEPVKEFQLKNINFNLIYLD